MKVEFTDLNQVSLERMFDNFNLKIKRPELFYPNFLKLSQAEIENISPIKFFRQVPPQIEQEKYDNIESKTGQMESLVRSTQAMSAFSIVFVGDDSL